MISRTLIWTGFTTLALALAGCETYRSEPLQPAKELDDLNKRDAVSVAGEVRALPAAPGLPVYRPEQALDEAELVMVALSFNPDLRGRRIAATQLGAATIGTLVRFNPELRASVHSVTAGIATDSEVLYTLLVPAARAALYDADRARTEQAQAEMLAAESQIASAVRRAHLELRLAWQRDQLLARQIARCQAFADGIAAAGPLPADPLSPALAAWELAELHAQARAAHEALAAARRALNQLLGFTPDYQLRVRDLESALPAPSAEEPSDEAIDSQILRGRWELKASEAQYRRDDYEARRKAFEQYPVLKLAPAITYDRVEGSSFALGASLRVPWPAHAAEEYDNARLQRSHDRATYVARLHQYRADAHGDCARMRAARLELEAGDAELGQAQLRTSALIAQAWAAHALSAHDYLALLRQQSADERRRLEAQGDWLAARIDLDHDTGRLNTIQANLPGQP
jgi:outer membrane protein TolC